MNVDDLGGLAIFPWIYLKGELTGIAYNLHTTTSIVLNITSSDVFSNHKIF
ncbi:MAG: hypothetical protein ACI9J3_001658 [Parvicellaceae bacterium]|jgi:hypothetical protein